MCCSVGRRLAIPRFALLGRAGLQQRFKEEPMKSVSELDEMYDRWATENEARAEEILASQDCYAYEVRQHQLERASRLLDEAAVLKKRAAELRKLDQRTFDRLFTPITIRDRSEVNRP